VVAGIGTAVTAVPLPPVRHDLGRRATDRAIRSGVVRERVLVDRERRGNGEVAVTGPSVRDAVSTPSLQLTK
jgi:hypothetical protein